MGRDTFLKMLPHIQYNTLVVPPVNIPLLGFFQISLPSVHSQSFVSACKVSVKFSFGKGKDK